MDLTSKCSVCTRNVQQVGAHIKCINCKHLNHLNCVRLTCDEAANARNWYCPKCVQSILPFNHHNDDMEFRQSIIEINLNGTHRQFAMDSSRFDPFILNESHHVPLYDIDPDIQFHLDTQHMENTNCDYYCEDTFNAYTSAVTEDHLNTFSLLHFDIRSLPTHFDDFTDYLELLTHKFTVIGLTETWLKHHNFDLFELKHYNSFHKYREKQSGGGVTFYIQEDIKFTIRDDLGEFDEELEMIFIEIEKSQIGTDRNVILGLMYRIPGTSAANFNDKLNISLQKISLENKICQLMGDLNLDLLKQDRHHDTSAFIDIIYSNGFVPVITKPTRITEHSQTLIDHIYTNTDLTTPNYKHRQGILRTDISDHYPVFYLMLKPNSSKNDNENYYIAREINPTNIAQFCAAIEEIDWQCVTTESDSQAAFTIFHEQLMNKYNASFPKKRYKKSYHNRKPWLSSTLKECIKRKNKLYISAKRNRISNEIYKNYKNRLSHLLKVSEKQYYQESLEKHRSNMRKTWEIIKMVINKNKNKTTNSEFLVNNRLTTDKTKVANGFNKYFVNVGATLAKAIAKPNVSPMHYIQQTVMETFYINPATENEIAKIFSNFKDSASGWDNLSPAIIKTIKQHIKQPITHICNLSFANGYFPCEMKLAKVIPIFKNGDKHLFQNYRPVSVLPCLSKIFERLMYNRLVTFIEKHQLINDLQFGFRKDRSAYMALIEAVDIVTNALDRGETVVGVSLDLSKAFDTVNHMILIEKCDKYGIRGVAKEWLISYLNGRKHHITESNQIKKRYHTACPKGLYWDHSFFSSISMIWPQFQRNTGLYYLQTIQIYSLSTKTNKLNKLILEENWKKYKLGWTAMNYLWT